jgi:spermidine synthase
LAQTTLSPTTPAPAVSAQTVSGQAVSGANPPRDNKIRLIDKARLPGGGELLLLQSGTSFSIELDEEELMGNTDYVSEQALATMTAQRLGRDDGSILIGGLGMGFTLGAAMDAWGPQARIHVAELVPEILAWAKGPLAHVFAGKLDDPRVRVTLGDVHDAIARGVDARGEGQYDAILLDVDNGPDGFVQKENDRLYGPEGLRAAYAALRPGGVLAVWSADPDVRFTRALARAGFAVEAVPVPAYEGAQRDVHCLWFAMRE